MRRANKLTERDFSRIVKQIISENMYSDEELEMMHDPEFQKNDHYTPVTNDLGTKIEKLIWNSNYSNEEIVSILRNIADEIENSRKFKNNLKDRWNK